MLRYAILLLALVAALRQAPSAQTPAVQTRLDVRIFGHRGFTKSVPENSLASLNAAAALGLAGAEIDLRTTRDGEVVLMHDATVDRTTTGAGLVSAMSRDAVGRLRLKNLDGTVTAEPVPDLAAVLAFLARHSTFRVAFDAKEIDVAAVGRRVLAANVQDRVMFFIDDMADAGRAKAIKRVDPRLKLSINLRAWWQIEGLATFARTALDADALLAHEFYLPRFGFQEAARTGAEVQVYLPGVDNLVDRFKRAAGMGANLVSSDRPDLLVPLVLPGPENRTRPTSAPSGSSR
jgi:glycerophosphoryl diester phosphodiesterase